MSAVTRASHSGYGVTHVVAVTKAYPRRYITVGIKDFMTVCIYSTVAHVLASHVPAYIVHVLTSYVPILYVLTVYVTACTQYKVHVLTSYVTACIQYKAHVLTSNVTAYIAHVLTSYVPMC
jgi:hypothetical protein